MFPGLCCKWVNKRISELSKQDCMYANCTFSKIEPMGRFVAFGSSGESLITISYVSLITSPLGAAGGCQPIVMLSALSENSCFSIVTLSFKTTDGGLDSVLMKQKACSGLRLHSKLLERWVTIYSGEWENNKHKSYYWHHHHILL